MKKRLLVVEDNARLLQAIAVCLRQANFDVMTARNGDEALFQIAETIPDLIVTDIMMPVADGYSLVRQLRANPRTDLIPVIFLTARDAKLDRLEGIRAGVDSYLVKPFEPNELVAVIENILNRVSRTHQRVARASGGEQSTDAARNAKKNAPASDLTEAEERVAALVSQTLSNKEIAARLKVSVRTIEMHISNILSKMNWSNRVEIARFVIERRNSAK